MRALVTAALLALATPALAGDAVSIEAVRRVQTGYGDPSITFVGGTEGSINAKLTCAGKAFVDAGPITRGSKRTLVLSGLPEGKHLCSGRLILEAADGSRGEMPLSLDVQVLPVLTLKVEYDDLDMANKLLTVQASRPLRKVTVDVIGTDGQTMGQGETPGGDMDRVDVQWVEPFGGEVMKIVVTGWDRDDLPGKVELSPWSYDIPHEDVVFDTNEAVVKAGEVPKLETAWTDLQDVLAKYGAIVEVKLFVAGYTDTVGDQASNLALSERRARAIAQWFRDRGFKGPISYQGFGEGVLAVMTPDQTDEAKNRRALYVLAAEKPPVSGDLPSSAWKRLE